MRGGQPFAHIFGAAKFGGKRFDLLGAQPGQGRGIQPVRIGDPTQTPAGDSGNPPADSSGLQFRLLELQQTDQGSIYIPKTQQAEVIGVYEALLPKNEPISA